MHALVTADTIGGVWTYVRELVTGLVRRGVHVTLVSFGDIPTPSQMEWMNELYDLDFRPTGFHLEWMQDAERDIRVSSEYLQAIVQEVEPDVIHLNQYCYGSLEMGAPKIVVAHSDVVSWWVSVHGEQPPPNRWSEWYRSVVTAGIAGADVVVAPSQWMLSNVHANYTRPTQEYVIYNGRTPTLFNPHITKEEYVLSVGRLWDGGKQTALLTKIDPGWPVYIAGAEQHPESGQGFESLWKNDRVYLRGVLSEAQLRHLYGRAPVYVATSRYEPFGLAPLEAALSRCAIVANNIDTFHELWGDRAFYFDRNSGWILTLIASRWS
jgi:glycosyltransferase involved in cell wall biosynthesis